MRALLVSPDTDSFDIHKALANNGFTVDEHSDVDDALQMSSQFDYDVAIYIAEAEGMNGARHLIQNAKRLPVVVETSGCPKSRLSFLEMGADDIIAFRDRDESLARIKRSVTRSRGLMDESIKCGPITINLTTGKVTVSGKPVQLTGREIDLLKTLALRKNNLVRQSVIMDHMYNGLNEPEPKIIDVYVCKIRKKLAAFEASEYLQTHWGEGYSLNDKPQPVYQTKVPYKYSIQIQVLEVLSQADAVDAHGITSVLQHRQYGSIVAAIRILRNSGLVEERTGPHRLKPYAITDAGRAHLAAAHKSTSI